MKIDTFDTNFESNSSSVLQLEMWSVCWALNSHPPSMNYRRLWTYHLTLSVERQALNLVVVGSSPTVSVLLLTLAVK